MSKSKLTFGIYLVHGRRIFETWTECEKLVAEGKVKPNLIVSHQFKMSQSQEAFECLLSGKACKIVIDPKN